MKKLLKFMGLLLVAGALFMGCQQNVDIDTDEITLSDGTWDYNKTTTVAYEQTSIKYSWNYFSEGTFKIADKKFTYIKWSVGTSASFTVPDSTPDSYMDEYKKQVEKMPSLSGATVTVNGKTITAKYTKSATADEIAEMNEGDLVAGDFAEGLPDDATIKRNKNKTEYKVTYTIPAEDEDDYDAKVVITFKKKK